MADILSFNVHFVNQTKCCMSRIRKAVELITQADNILDTLDSIQYEGLSKSHNFLLRCIHRSLYSIIGTLEDIRIDLNYSLPEPEDRIIKFDVSDEEDIQP